MVAMLSNPCYLRRGSGEVHLCQGRQEVCGVGRGRRVSGLGSEQRFRDEGASQGRKRPDVVLQPLGWGPGDRRSP